MGPGVRGEMEEEVQGVVVVGCWDQLGRAGTRWGSQKDSKILGAPEMSSQRDRVNPGCGQGPTSLSAWPQREGFLGSLGLGVDGC